MRILGGGGELKTGCKVCLYSDDTFCLLKVIESYRTGNELAN